MFVQQGSIAALLNLLTPWDVGPFGKIKYGNHYGDGGYVMLKNLRPEQVVYSFGIDQNAAFELDLAKRGHAVHVFDQDFDAVPVEHENFRFHRESIGPTDDGDNDVYSLDHFMTLFGHSQTDMILKIDVKGAEWPVLNAISDERLC